MRDTRYLNWLLGGTLAVLLAVVLGGCGTASSTASRTASSGSGTSAGAPPQNATPTASATAMPTASATGVTLIPGAAHYGGADTITITIHNATGQPIYAAAHASDCTPVAVEQLVAGSWKLVKPCKDENPHPAITSIAPGATSTVRLPATAPVGNTQGSPTPGWPAGTYRAALTYTTSATQAFSQGATAYSATFTVG